MRAITILACACGIAGASGLRRGTGNRFHVGDLATRKEALRTAGGLAGALAGTAGLAQPGRAAERTEEKSTYSTVSKVAANIPGYGPPDVFYPAGFLGKWKLRRELLSLDTKGEASPESFKPLLEERLLSALPSMAVEYPVRFIRLGENIICDREFNERNYFAALADARGQAEKKPVGSSWDPTSPNVLTLTLGSGEVIEKKVTKRGTEADAVAQGGFGSSEFARIAESSAEGIASSAPQITAIRTLTRWRFDPAASADRIDGLELTLVYQLDNMVLGTDNAKPSRVRKCRLSLVRQGD